MAYDSSFNLNDADDISCKETSIKILTSPLNPNGGEILLTNK